MSFSPRAGAGALLLAALLAAPAAAQTSADALRHAGTHVLTVGPSGGLACDLATERQLAELQDDRARRAGVRLTALPSLNGDRVGTFRIILRATDQLLAQPEALLSFRRAAAQWERIIQNEVTTVIDVDYGPERFGAPWPDGVLGSTNSALEFSSSPGGVISRLKSSTDDAQLLALYDAIPVPTPSTVEDGGTTQNLNRGIGGLIPLQILGSRPAQIDPDDPDFQFGDVPVIGFNSAFPYDFDPVDGIDSDKTDFEGVVLHEIGHALGFSSAIGISVAGQDPLFTVWDLFRVRPDAVTPGESLTDGAGFETAQRVVTPGPPNTELLTTENGVRYFKAVQTFFDGENEYDTSTATGSREGGDGQQASHWRDDALRPPSLGGARKIGIMDPNIGRGETDALSFADLRMLEVIGYDIDFSPAEATIALSVGGQAVDDRFLVSELSFEEDSPGTATIPVVIGNETADQTLSFEAAVELDSSFPDGATFELALSQTEGTVAPDGSVTLQLTVETSEASFGLGRLRIQANDPARAVIDVPFSISVGGVSEPALAIAGEIPESLGDIDGAETRTITLQNTGSLPLDYRVIAASAAETLLLSSTPPEARQRPPLFEATFEDAADINALDFNKLASPDRWQTRTDGRATLPGHSAPTALYYGAVGGSEYNDNTLGQIDLPALDLSGLDPSDRVTFSFAYSLGAEAGFDFASVVVSYDGGDSFEELASSDGGILQNSDGWETVEIEVPGVAGFPRDVLFGFRFTSDASVTEEGWYLDDIVVDVEPGVGSFFASPVAGTIEGNGSVDVTLTANGSVLDRGFYRGLVDIRTNQRRDDPPASPVAFTVGSPDFPTVVLRDENLIVQAQTGIDTDARLAVENGGDATLSYVRVLEPAASAFEPPPARLAGADVALVRPGTVDAPVETASETSRHARTRPDGDVLGSIELPAGAVPFDIAQGPDGTVYVLDGANVDETRVYALPENLSGSVPSPFTVDFGSETVGIAWNVQTESLWIAVFRTGRVQEVTLADGVITPTGRSFGLGFSPFGMAYSPELDAFVIGAFQTSAALALSAEGELLPGYPVFVDGADANTFTGVTFTEGLLEMTGTRDEILQRGQFGRPFDGQVSGTIASDVLSGAEGVYALHRDKRDPNGSFYVATRANASGRTQIVRFDPVDLQDGIGTRFEARQPLFADRSIDPRAAFDLRLTVEGDDLAVGTYTEDLTLLTNDPVTPLVRLPLTVSVNAVSDEGGAPGALTLDGVRPNPLRTGGSVRFALAAPGDVTVAVYDVLGRRVALLADRQPMEAGPHALPLRAGTLAPGVYVVRLQAGDVAATRKVTVVR